MFASQVDLRNVSLERNPASSKLVRSHIKETSRSWPAQNRIGSLVRQKLHPLETLSAKRAGSKQLLSALSEFC